MFCYHSQDCLWAGRCIKRGWFLPYAPAEKEFGAWKNHYVSCVSTLDWLTPREAAEQYGTLNQQTTGITGEEEEKRKERRIRQMIRDKLQEERSEWKRNNSNERMTNIFLTIYMITKQADSFFLSWFFALHLSPDLLTRNRH